MYIHIYIYIYIYVSGARPPGGRALRLAGARGEPLFLVHFNYYIYIYTCIYIYIYIYM